MEHSSNFYVMKTGPRNFYGDNLYEGHNYKMTHTIDSARIFDVRIDGLAVPTPGYWNVEEVSEEFAKSKGYRIDTPYLNFYLQNKKEA